MMKNFSEHRLLYRTIQSINEQRASVGQQPLNTTIPTGTTQRNTQTNASLATVNNPTGGAPLPIQAANDIRLIQQANQGLSINEKERALTASGITNQQDRDAVLQGQTTIDDLLKSYESRGIKVSAPTQQVSVTDPITGLTSYKTVPIDYNTQYDQYARNLQNQKYNAGADLSNSIDQYGNALSTQQQYNYAGMPTNYEYTNKSNMYDTSGNVSLDVGNIERNAIDRIMKERGLSEPEAYQYYQKNKDQIQAAFNQVGTTYTAPGITNPEQSYNDILKQQQNDIQNTKGYVKRVDNDGNVFYVEDQNATDIAKREKAQYYQNQTALQQQKQQMKEAGASSAMSETTTGEKQPQDTIPQENIFASLPKEYQDAFAPLNDVYNQAISNLNEQVKQGKMDRDTAISEAQKVRDDSIEKAIQQDRDYKNLLDRFDENARQRAENTRKQQEEDNQYAQDRFNLENQRALAIQRQQNTETELSNRIFASKLGVNFDTGGIKWMQDQQQKGVDAITYLINSAAIENKDFANKAHKIARDYNATMDDIDATTLKNYFDENRAFNDEVRNIKKDYGTQTKEALDRYDALLKDYNDKLYQIDKDKGDKYLEAYKQMQEEHATVLKQEREDKNNLIKQWNDHISTYGNTNPIGAQGIIEQMKKMGMDVSGFNPDAPTLEQIDKIQKQVTQTSLQNARGQYVDEKTDQDLALVLRNSAINLTDKKYDQSISDGLDMLASGDIKNFKRLVLQNARDGMDVTTRGEVNAREDIVKATSGVLDILKEMKRDDLGYYNNLVQSGKTYAGVEKDPKFTKLKASIQFAQSQLRNKLFGANLTGTEAENANDFLLNFKTDKVGDILNKIESLNGSIDDSLDTRYDFFLGDGVYRNFIRNGVSTNDLTSPNKNPTIYKGDDGKKALDDIWNGTSKPTSFLDTLAQAHIQHEGFGSPAAKTITKGNNPGALKYTDTVGKKYGAKRGSNNFAMFPDVESGYKALKDDLRAKITGGSSHIDYSKNPTLLSYVNVYAPAADNNNPGAYALSIVNSLNDAGYNVDLNTPLSELASLIG